MLAHLLFTLQHRADVRPYTSSYDLAESCVFIKQSPLPILCHLFLSKEKKKVLFLPKLQSHFAEFLQYSYLKHLSLLDKSTCVGLGYGFFFIIFLEKEDHSFCTNKNIYDS